MKRKALSLLLAMVLCVGLIGCAAPGKAEVPDEQSNSGEIAADLLASEAVKPVSAEALSLSVTKLSTSSGSGLDKSGADAFYKQLSAYNGQGYDVLYADLKDMDGDGVPELLVVSSEKAKEYTINYDTAVADIWQIRNGTASKVTSADCYPSLFSSLGYYTYGGKMYILNQSHFVEWGNYSVSNTFITTGGFVEEFGESGAAPSADEPQDFLYFHQGSSVTEQAYRQYAGAFVSAEKMSEGPGVLVHPGMDGLDMKVLPDEFMSGGGRTWIVEETQRATYQIVLNQLSAVKDTTGSMGSTGSTSTSTGFTDVSASAYYAESVAWAIQKGITEGTGNNQFSPNQNCTNAQILTFLWRAYGRPEPTISNPFTNNITEAYRKAAIWAYEKGMVSGRIFDADKPCTRAMAMTYMWQAAGSPATSTGGNSYGPYTISGTNWLGDKCSVTFSSASAKTATVALCTDEFDYMTEIMEHSGSEKRTVTLVSVPVGSDVKVYNPTAVATETDDIAVTDYVSYEAGVYHSDGYVTDVPLLFSGPMNDYPAGVLIEFNEGDYLVVPTSGTGTSGTFSDVPSNASYAQAVTWAVANGITNGTSDTAFSPNNVCTRAQIVTFLYRNLAK